MATNKNIKINLDYSSFVGGISECQSKIQILNNEFKLQSARMGETASSTDKLNLKSQVLNQQISLQEQVVSQAMAKWEAMANSENSTIQQVEAAHKAFQKQATILANMRNELESVNNSLDETSNSEESVSNASERGSQGFGTYASSIASTISVITSMISALDTVGQKIEEVATKSTEWADELSTTAAQIGVSTTTLQKWAYAADLVDVSVETMQGSMVKLTKNMGAAAEGSSSAQAKFDALGVSVMGANNQLKSSEQVFYECIDALGNIDNQAQRDALAMDIFGKSATQLNTLIDAGSSMLSAYGDEAERLGLIVGEDGVDALASMNDSFDKFNHVMEAAQNRLSAAFAPAIATVVDAIAELDPNLLTVIAGMGMVLNLASSLAPAIQAVAMVTTMSTAAKIANTTATTAETAAETGLAGAALAADAALLPQIVTIALIIAAVAGLILIIKELVEMFNEEADAADKAAESTKNFTSAASGSSTSANGSSNAPTSEHHALGGWTRNNRVWVGEQGAELVDLPVGSYVHNSTDSRNMSSTNNVFNVTIDAKSVDDFNKVVNVFSGLSQSMNRGSRVNG